MQQVAPVYVSGAVAPPLNDEMEYNRYRSLTVVPEYFPRRADTEVYDRPPRLEYRDQDQTPRPEYYRDSLDARAHSRPAPPPPPQPVDTYEIVQVRDGSRAYVYRRPVRPETAAQYFHDVERRTYRDADPYEPVPYADNEQPPYAMDSRGAPVGRYTRQGTVMREETHRGSRGGDPYHEEYDPRFPAAP